MGSPPMFGATFFVELSLNSTATDCNAAAFEKGRFSFVSS